MGAAQVVALAAAAVIKDRGAAVSVAYGRQARRDLTDRGVPVDLLVAAVGAPAQGRGDARVPLVVGQPLSLLTCIALRAGVRLVALHADDVAVVDLEFDSAVAGAEDACRG